MWIGFLAVKIPYWGSTSTHQLSQQYHFSSLSQNDEHDHGPCSHQTLCVPCRHRVKCDLTFGRSHAVKRVEGRNQAPLLLLHSYLREGGKLFTYLLTPLTNYHGRHLCQSLSQHSRILTRPDIVKSPHY